MLAALLIHMLAAGRLTSVGQHLQATGSRPGLHCQCAAGHQYQHGAAAGRSDGSDVLQRGGAGEAEVQRDE